MRLGFKYESRPAPRVEKEIELSKLQLHYSRRSVRRFAVLALVMLSICALAFRLDIDRPLKWFVLALSVAFLAMSLLFTGVFTSQDDEQLDPVRYYGRGTLIFLGIFWGAAVCGLLWMIYVSFPRA